MPTTRRIRMKPTSRVRLIIGIDGSTLGEFVPGLGYWVTPQNINAVEEVLAFGEAVEVDASTAPFGGLEVSASPAEVTGSISIGA